MSVVLVQQCHTCCHAGISTNLKQLLTCNSFVRHNIQLQSYPVNRVLCHLTCIRYWIRPTLFPILTVVAFLLLSLEFVSVWYKECSRPCVHKNYNVYLHGISSDMAIERGTETVIAILLQRQVFFSVLSRPKCFPMCSQMWSLFKHHNTAKLLELHPQGTVSLISNCWGQGHVSNKFIAELCGVLNELLLGDLVLADRDFDIEDRLRWL